MKCMKGGERKADMLKSYRASGEQSRETAGLDELFCDRHLRE